MFSLMPYYVGLVVTIFAQEWLKFPILIHVYLAVCILDILIIAVQMLLKKGEDNEPNNLQADMESSYKRNFS